MNSLERANEAWVCGDLVEGKIVERVKGGFRVSIYDGLLAFLPGAQFDLRPRRDPKKFVGQEYKFKVIEVNKHRKNVVLSRRVILEEEQRKKKEKTLKQLETNKNFKGKVVNVVDYGAFVDIGGVDGLLHRTQMNGKLTIGQELDVKVLNFDGAKERISLSLL